ncbi:MAG: glycogen synthase GlgA [Pseudomonadota bacterium]
MDKQLKVLFLSPEVVPYAKSGGLADVAGSLPEALKRLGADVRLVLPFYRVVREGNFQTHLLFKDLEVPLGKESLTADVFETITDEGVPVYLVEREDLYDRPNLYGNARGDYYDNLERFSFFAHASLRLTEALPFRPHILHCHDWQTGLVPALIKGPYKEVPSLADAQSVFTIHNLGYPGLFHEDKLPITGLPRKGFFNPDGMEYWGNISLLKAGIVYSEAVTTVSPRYAQEIQTPEYGMGMEGILYYRRDHLHGILNGVDYRLWDPAKDPNISAPYSPRMLEGKKRCKESLIQEMGLDPSLKSRPLIGMISRLDAQKGLDILVKILDDLLALDVGLVILGSGDEGIQQAIKEAADHHHGRLGLFIGFNETLAHRIMAGADIFLIPSRYEPCGLTQMYALKYGTVPVVRATGGLEDTIVQFDPKNRDGNGFKFGPYDPQSLLSIVQDAVDLYKDTGAWKRLRANGMGADFSWDRSASEYMDIYRSILKK